MPTVQGTDIFDNVVSGNYDAFFGTPTAVTSPLYQSQANSLEINSPGNEGVRKNITGSPTKGWSAFAFRYPTALPASDVVTLGVQDAAGSVARVTLSASGIYASLSGVSSSTTSITADAWHWIEAILDVNDGTGIKKLYWRVDGVDKATVEFTSTASTISFAQLVSLTGNGTLTWYAGIWKWGTAATTSDWLGEPSVPTGLIFKRLYGPAQLPDVATTLYTVPTGKRAVIRHIHAINPTGTARDISLSIGTDAAATRIFDGKPIAAGGLEELRRGAEYTLAAGEVLQGFASAASSIVLVVDGYEEPA